MQRFRAAQMQKFTTNLSDDAELAAACLAGDAAARRARFFGLPTGIYLMKMNDTAGRAVAEQRFFKKQTGRYGL